MPSISGIRTSISTTSGRSSRISGTASAPVAASPTTSMSASAPRITRSAVRTIRSSSASTMRRGRGTSPSWVRWSSSSCFVVMPRSPCLRLTLCSCHLSRVSGHPVPGFRSCVIRRPRSSAAHPPLVAPSTPGSSPRLSPRSSPGRQPDRQPPYAVIGRGRRLAAQQPCPLGDPAQSAAPARYGPPPRGSRPRGRAPDSPAGSPTRPPRTGDGSRTGTGPACRSALLRPSCTIR